MRRRCARLLRPKVREVMGLATYIGAAERGARSLTLESVERIAERRRSMDDDHRR
jgi:hypothetical protein